MSEGETEGGRLPLSMVLTAPSSSSPPPLSSAGLISFLLGNTDEKLHRNYVLIDHIFFYMWGCPSTTTEFKWNWGSWMKDVRSAWASHDRVMCSTFTRAPTIKSQKKSVATTSETIVHDCLSQPCTSWKERKKKGKCYGVILRVLCVKERRRKNGVGRERGSLPLSPCCGAGGFAGCVPCRRRRSGALVLCGTPRLRAGAWPRRAGARAHACGARPQVTTPRGQRWGDDNYMMWALINARPEDDSSPKRSLQGRTLKNAKCFPHSACPHST